MIGRRGARGRDHLARVGSRQRLGCGRWFTLSSLPVAERSRDLAKPPWRAPVIIDEEEERQRREARRRRFVEVFAVEQRRKRRWISLKDIALYIACDGRISVLGAYRHLAELLRRNELCGSRGRSRILFLDIEPHLFAGQHRLSSGVIDGAIWTEAPIEQRDGGPASLHEYSDDDFAPCSFVVTNYLERAFVTREDAARILERLGLTWPPHFEPEHARLDRPATADHNDAAASATSAVTRHRRPGPPPVKRERVKSAMKADIESQRITVDQLAREKDTVLEKLYGASRNTVKSARKETLSELSKLSGFVIGTNTGTK